ncbi:interleukin-18-binding protein isoform X2 [Zootoca vivipara]|uniref:interleukin-18-binding protein isoform X2 n=1 Tax=Zootoca vivipara TaxID=8524 RepID=UPI001590235D|nr:interleukin-18-binding protein isoform X2 [Zootoca vivipara]
MSSATGFRHQARCLLLALICSGTSFQESAANVQPHISSDLVAQKPSCSKQIRIPCEGYTDYEDSGIMYWLANGQFVSELYPRGEVSEGRTEEKAKGVGLSLKRELIINNFTKKIQNTRFECVILDPAGAARKAVNWKPTPRFRNQRGKVPEQINSGST